MTHTVDIVKKYINISVKLSDELSQLQLSLNLESIFFAESLASDSVRRESLEKVKKMRDLSELHKDTYSRLLVQFEEEVLSSLDSLSESESVELIKNHKIKLQKKIDEQYEFYKCRDGWIKSTEELLLFLEDNKGEYELVGDTLLLSDKIFDSYIYIDSRIKEYANKERKIGEARKRRMFMNSQNLGFEFKIS